MISSNPAPPASTTPASLSTASRSGVRASDSSPRATMNASSSGRSRPRASARLRRLGHLADHRQHRPFDRAADGAVGGVARGAKRARDHRLVDRIALAEHVGEAADDLAEDDARVAACPHQRGAGELARDGLVPVGIRLLERLDDRAHRERQVRAGVAVGNRVDVEVVDALLIRLEIAEREAGDLAGAVEVHDERLTSSMRTSTAATESPVCRSTS